MATDNDLTSKAATGREVRIAGSRYTLSRVGSEIQTITLAADDTVSSDFWSVSLIHSGLSGETHCLPYDASADDVDEAVESLAAVDAGGVVVTRRGSGTHGDPYVHSVYFEGGTVAGDVNELVINSTGCNPRGNDEPENALAYVSTIQNGGRVERQTLALATEAGYVRGDYFRLAYNDSSLGGSYHAVTDCLEWGVGANEMAEALSALPALGEISPSALALYLNTTGKDAFPSTEVTLSNDTFVDGRLKRGDVIHVSGSYGGNDTEHVIESISTDGRSVVFESSFRAASGTGGSDDAMVTLVVRDPVVVARSGTGKSVIEIQRVVLTATDEVTPLSGQGFFRLQWAHDGKEHVTGCLEFGAEASTVQSAMEGLGYDLDGSDSSYEEGDEGHILVTREGDGSASSGYGYTYVFEFRGVAGVSTVVGNVEQVQVSAFVCHRAKTITHAYTCCFSSDNLTPCKASTGITCTIVWPQRQVDLGARLSTIQRRELSILTALERRHANSALAASTYRRPRENRWLVLARRMVALTSGVSSTPKLSTASQQTSQTDPTT